MSDECAKCPYYWDCLSLPSPIQTGKTKLVGSGFWVLRLIGSTSITSLSRVNQTGAHMLQAVRVQRALQRPVIHQGGRQLATPILFPHLLNRWTVYSLSSDIANVKTLHTP